MCSATGYPVQNGRACPLTDRREMGILQPVAIEPHEEKPIGPLLASTGLVIALIMGFLG
jgi:hypothetical protein